MGQHLAPRGSLPQAAGLMPKLEGCKSRILASSGAETHQ